MSWKRRDEIQLADYFAKCALQCGLEIQTFQREAATRMLAECV